VKNRPPMLRVMWSVAEAIAAYALLCLLFRSARIVARPGRLQVRSGFFGLGRTKTFPAEDIQEIRVELSGKGGGRDYYRIRIIRRRGWGRQLIGGLSNRQEADWLAREMTRQIRLSEST